jgi:hypothetical protein
MVCRNLGKRQGGVYTKHLKIVISLIKAMMNTGKHEYPRHLFRTISQFLTYWPPLGSPQ